MARSQRTVQMAAVAAAVVLLGAGCGLQKAGVDGVVTASQANGGLPGSSSDVGTGGAGSGQNGGAGIGGTGAPNGTGGSLPGGGGGAGSFGGGGSGISGGSGTATGTGSGGSGGTGGGTGNGGTGGTGTTSASGLHGSVTLGFEDVTGFSDLEKYFNVHVGDYGDPNQQVQAMANWVNAHGGIGGRKMNYKVVDVNAQQSSASNEQAECQTFKDAGAFAVVLHGQIHPETRGCYRDNKMISIEGSNYGFSKKFYDSMGGWDLAPYFPTYDQADRALVAAVKSRNWLAGDKKVGIVSWSDSDYQHVVHDVLEPQLRGAGVTSFDEYPVSNADAGQMQNGVNQAAQKLHLDGVTRVFFVGSAPLQPFFFIAADSQHIQFKYAMTTYDDMLYEQMNNGHSTDQLVGALGVGVFPVDDIADDQLPFPQPGQEAQCAAIYKAAGVPHIEHRIDGTYSSKQAISYCETTLLIKAAADRVGANLSKPTFVAAVQGLGSSMRMASSYATRFSSGSYTGTAAARLQLYDASSKTWKFASGNVALS